MKVQNVRHLAKMAGRRYVQEAKRLPSVATINKANPWVHDPAGTKPDARHHENSRHDAWYEGALDARGDRRKVKA